MSSRFARLSVVLILGCVSVPSFAGEYVKYAMKITARSSGQAGYSGYRCHLKATYGYPRFVLNRNLTPSRENKEMEFLSGGWRNYVWDTREIKSEITQILNRKDSGITFGEPVHDRQEISVVEHCQEDTTRIETYTYTCGNQTCTDTRTVTDTDYTIASYECPIDHSKLEKAQTVLCRYKKMLRQNSFRVAKVLQQREITLQLTHVDQGVQHAYTDCRGDEAVKYLVRVQGGLYQGGKGEDDFLLNLKINGGETITLKSDTGAFDDSLLICNLNGYERLHINLEGREVDMIKDDMYRSKADVHLGIVAPGSVEVDMYRTFMKYVKHRFSKLLFSVEILTN